MSLLMMHRPGLSVKKGGNAIPIDFITEATRIDGVKTSPFN